VMGELGKIGPSIDTTGTVARQRLPFSTTR